MKENFIKVKDKVKDNIDTQIKMFIEVVGKMISKMTKIVYFNLLLVPFTEVKLKMENFMDKED